MVWQRINPKFNQYYKIDINQYNIINEYMNNYNYYFEYKYGILDKLISYTNDYKKHNMILSYINYNKEEEEKRFNDMKTYYDNKFAQLEKQIIELQLKISSNKHIHNELKKINS